MAVVWRSRNGAYILVEVNRTVLHLKFAAFHLIPYHSCSRMYLEIMEFVDKKDIDKEEEEETIEDMKRTLFLERKGKVWEQPLGYLQNSDILPLFISFP